MKLGVSYNIFDGEELLESSIKSIRDNVDYISVVYQTVSNFNNPCNGELVPLLEKLKSKKLIDELVHYTPNFQEHCSTNERNKRNVGVGLSRKNDCTHHMSMDADEFYTDEQFKYMKKVVIGDDYDSSACKLITYYKSSEFKFSPNEVGYVSLIFKINNGQEYLDKNPMSSIIVDPTRQMKEGKLKIFNRDEIEMHHMSHVRKNLRKKWENSSAKSNIINFESTINIWVNHYESFTIKDVGCGFPGNPQHKIIKTEKLFDIGNCC